MPDHKQWYLLYCKSRDEQRAQQNLKNQFIESYYPLLHVERIKRGKKVLVEEALFPSYLFVLLDTLSTNFNAVRSTRGVIDFVKCGAAYLKVDSSLVLSLKNQAFVKDTVTHLPSPGSEVEVCEGPFKGLKGIYQKEDGLERSMLLIKMLNQESEISIANTDILL